MDHYRKAATRDPLTRVANRRGLAEALDQAMKTAHADEGPLCMIMADIDHFTPINDIHGLLVVDNVLRMVAATLQTLSRGATASLVSAARRSPLSCHNRRSRVP